MVDLDREARDVAIRNAPDVPYLATDIHSLSGADVRRAAHLEPREPVHVLIGGPPCQGFSWLGRRALDDERNVHLFDFLRMMKELRPLVGVIENVPLIITSHEGAIIEEVCDGLGSIGYSCCADTLIASDFGVPQLRKRAFVVAYHADLGIPPQMPQRTHERVTVAAQLFNGESRMRFEPAKLPYVSVHEAIGDLPPLKAGEGDDVTFYSDQQPPQSRYQCWAREDSVAIFNHRSRAHSEKFIEKIGVIQEGGRNQELPDGERFSDNYYSQAYARLHRTGIAQTVTTSFGNPGSGRFMHYRDLRSITVREAARFQSFPDWFAFDGTQVVQMRHVGNAVPPLMARAIGEQVLRDLIAAGCDGSETWRRAQPVEKREQRSRIMRAVPGKNTSTELALRAALRAVGIRGYRLHSRRVPGSPDLVFGIPRVAVFVDGCFWHGCPKCYRRPKTNLDYWRMKVQRNRDRDAKVDAACKEAGWKVVRVWEHDVNRAPSRVAARIRTVLIQRRDPAMRGRTSKRRPKRPRS
jgi:DNA mismatch endonuclease Vsr